MAVDRLDVSRKIKQGPHASNDGRQKPDVREADLHAKALLIDQMTYLDASYCSIYLHRSKVAVTLHHLNAGNGARLEKCEHAIPVVGRTITKPKLNVFLSHLLEISSAQSARRTMKQFEKRFVESPQAAEASRHRNFCHGHLGLMYELLGKKHSSCLRDRNWRRPEVLEEQAAQLTLTHAHSLSQLLNTTSVAGKGAFCDESQGARNRIRGSTPRSQVRSSFRTATKARTEAGIL